MNAREVMQALLDGKTLVETIPKVCDEYLKMKGDELEYMGVLGKWRECDHILINPKYTSVKEDK